MRIVDLAVEELAVEVVEWVEVVAVSTPMHTALRVAEPVIASIHARRPELPVACFGLYAPMAAGMPGVVATFVGEYEASLVEWMTDPVPTARLDLAVDSYLPPVRSGLPGLEAYAHLQVGEEHRRVGYVEMSKGCRHRCRHCPIPAIYDGRYRLVDLDSVVEDVDRLVEMGAGHITVGDPDFLNGPVHSLRVLTAVKGRHPSLTFDVTAKVEHLLHHRALLPELEELGVIFVVSAFESVDPLTLRLLDKGHTPQDLETVVSLVRGAGIDIHPTWMPFTPITTPDHVAEIFTFLDRHDLFEVTDPVQLAIRLLVPRGSLVLEVEEIARHLGEYDPTTLSYRWSSADPRSDRLQGELAELAARQADTGSDRLETLVRMWETTLAVSWRVGAIARIPAGAVIGRPRLTEPWFC